MHRDVARQVKVNLVDSERGFCAGVVSPVHKIRRDVTDPAVLVSVRRLLDDRVAVGREGFDEAFLRGRRCCFEGVEPEPGCEQVRIGNREHEDGRYEVGTRARKVLTVSQPLHLSIRPLAVAFLDYEGRP